METARTDSTKPAALLLAVVVSLALATASAGCTNAQAQFDLQDVMVYIAAADEPGWVVVVPFYNLTYAGTGAVNVSMLITLCGADPVTMNGYNLQPVFTGGLYQPPLNMGLNAMDGEDATLRIHLTSDGEDVLDVSYVLGIGSWLKDTWLLLAAPA